MSETRIFPGSERKLFRFYCAEDDLGAELDQLADGGWAIETLSHSVLVDGEKVMISAYVLCNREIQPEEKAEQQEDDLSRVQANVQE